MQNIYHYVFDCEALNTSSGSRESRNFPLVVNCAGRSVVNEPSTNNNPKGRLDFYLIYIISGELIFFDGKKEILQDACSLIIYPPKKGYKFSCEKKGTSYLWVHFTGNDVTEILKRYNLSLFPKMQKTCTSNNISSRFQKLFEGFARNDELREYDLSALLDRLLIETSRAVKNQKNDRISLSKSIRYINEYYTTPIKITFLAKMEGMCMTNYNLHFKKQVGMSPTKYIIKLRIDSAKELLSFTDYSVKTIGELCGYQDFNFFSKVFKASTGLSPLAYRKSQKQ